MHEETAYVTGGAGFIGGHLVRLLVRDGWRVVVIERPGVDQGLLPQAVETRLADIRVQAEVVKALADCRGAMVYHLAANPHLWVRDRQEFDAVNHQGARHVLDAALAAGAQRVLHCSTESILTKKRWPAGASLNEQVEIDESDAVGPYCLSKLRAENYAKSLAGRGLPVVIANPTMPVGPNDPGPSPPTCLIRDFLAGRMPGYMDCQLNLVDVRDVAEGLVKVMEKGKAGRRHLLSGENMSLASLLQMLSGISGQKVPRWKIPYFVGFSYACLSEWMADYLTGQRPQATITGLRLARRVMHFDGGWTREQIGWEPRPIRNSLMDALTWLMR
ncbi:MAG: NAD-dependent epimerase/dehydratase family protein [bacterium]